MVIKKKLNGFTWFDVLNYIFLGLLALTTLYPMVNLVFISFAKMSDVIAGGLGFFVPKSFQLDAYKYALRTSGIGQAYIITLYITFFGTVTNMIMSVLAAYVLSERALPGRNYMTTFVLITMFFSGGMIPSYLVVHGLGLINSLWALILPGCINTWNMLIMRNFFQSISVSLKESARIDGASELTILVKIILPLSMPILATMVLFYGVGHWNQYSAAILYINDPKKYPLQVLIRKLYTQIQVEPENEVIPPPLETVRAASVVMAVLPILCVYPFLQKYFVKGMMVGALKG